MAKTKLEAKSWLVEELGFTDAEVADLLPKFESRMEKVNGGYMRQSDYDRTQNEAKAELKRQQDALTVASDRLNAEMAEWATLTAAEKQQATKLRSDLEASQADVLKYRQTVERIASDAGLDPAKVLEGMKVTVKPDEKKQPEIDLSGYVKADQLSGLADMMLTLPAELAAIAYEHQTLTGQHLDQRAIIAEIKTRAQTRGNTKSLDPRAVWEEMQEIPAKREAADKKRFDEAITAAEARGREAALTDAAIPGQAPQGRHAPVFQAQKSVLQRPQPGDRLNAALAALNTGKYKVESHKPA